ncbi:type II secretion system F family protein [Desulfoferula mesophila]|uniref:Type II secretion system protein GspF domain-containing protein n=1 Tax=Desulfoferula mesophila TaxID=3058419 RepID=A0AAU9EI69_9BACT|nr:hypothetical protein FAK_07420 [Desulfoferula mesophilus]
MDMLQQLLGQYDILIIVGLVALVSVVLLFAFWESLFGKTLEEKRVEQLVDDGYRLRTKKPIGHGDKKDAISQLVGIKKDRQSTSKIGRKKRIETLKLVVGIILAPILLFLTHFFILSPDSSMFGKVISYALAGLGGFIAPSLVFEYLEQKRIHEISVEIPRFLDLVVVTIESGLGLDAAFARVSREIDKTCPNLQKFLLDYIKKINSGMSREDALKDMAEQAENDDLTQVVYSLIQAQKYGVSIGRSLRVQNDDIRNKLKERAMEKAAKLPLKLLFPIMFGILPATILVMVGPAISRIASMPLF